MDERQQTYKTYFLLARRRYCGLRDGTNRQFFAEGLKDIWTSFEAYLGLKFPNTDNRAMQRDYADAFQYEFSGWQKSSRCRESLKQLQILASVKDMSPVNPRRDATLNNVDDLNELIFYLYRIRSNLIHGGKELEGDTSEAVRNRDLVEHAFNVTYEVLEKTLISEHMID